MFYDIYLMLCNKIGKKPSAVAAELKINKSNVSNWKSSGYTPRGEALQKIADHFHVSTDYLLGVTEQSKLDTAEFKVEEDLRLWGAKLDFAENDEQRAEAEKEIRRLTEEQARIKAEIAETKKTPAQEGELTSINNHDIRRIARAHKKMPKQDKERMLTILENAFPDYFSDDYVDEDTDE